MANELTAPVVADRLAPSRVWRAVADRLWWIAVIWLTALALGSILIGFTPANPEDFDFGQIVAPPSPEHWFGSDQLGRDILVRVLFGARVSLLVGVSAVVIGLVVGLILGLIAGYFSGIVRTIIGLITDSVLAFPVLVLISALVAIRGASVQTLVIGLSIGMLPTFVRIIRANTLTYATRDFVTAAKVMGARTSRILVREVLPNVLPPAIAYSLIVLGVAITAEGSLSFLGLGIPSPTPTWGSMIAQGRTVFATAPHVVFIPAAVLLFTILSLNVVGERLGGARRARLHIPI